MVGFLLVSVRCVLALVLIAAAAGKVWRRSGIEQFGLVLRGLGVPHALPVAGAWIAAEGVTALLLILPPTVRPGAELATAQFAVLTAGAVVLAARRPGFSCPCFGKGNAPIGWLTVLRNAGLTAAALLLALGLQFSRASAPAPVALAAVLTVGVGVLLSWQAPALRSLLGRTRRGYPAVAVDGRP